MKIVSSRKPAADGTDGHTLILLELQSEPKRQIDILFQQHDAVSDKFTESFDLILSRHTMIHLYNADALKVIQNFKDSGSK